MDKLFADEVIDGYRCDKCHQCNNVIHNSIVLSPKLLIIKLNRYAVSDENMSISEMLLSRLRGQEQIRKDNTQVDYPNILNIAPYITRTTQNSSHTNYELVSVICHIGTLNSGHYFAYCKDIHKRDTWFLCNDEHIQEVPISSALNHSNAYLLFYNAME